MTLQGAIQQLHDMRCNENFPIYYKPAIAEVIETILTDAQEVRRGRWTTKRTMEHDGETYCDQCGWTWENLTFDRTKVKRSPYCPNCGARMEVE